MTHAEMTIAHAKQLAALKEVVRELADRLAVVENRKNEIIVNVPQQAPPVVQYTPPVQEAPVVHINVPESIIQNTVNVPDMTPIVNNQITVPEAQTVVNNQINVPEGKPPVIKNIVQVPEQSKRETKTATKDENGNYTITIERT